MIFCVEDEKSIRDLIIYALKAQGFEATGFDNGEDMFANIRELNPKLILLDIMLPGIDGLEILRRLKSDEKTVDIPVIMLTAKGQEYYKITGLDSGADDYITKPFSVLELIARVKAALRRNKVSTNEQENKEKIISYDNVSIDLSSRVVKVDDKEVELTFKEFELLKILVENRGIVLSREKLLDEIWGFEFGGETRTVDVHIASLRGKLKDMSSHISTVRNVGYKFGEKEKR